MKVTSMANNQYIIEHNGVTYFQSYDVIVAKKSKGKTILDKDYYQYSRTTIRLVISISKGSNKGWKNNSRKVK